LWGCPAGSARFSWEVSNFGYLRQPEVPIPDLGFAAIEPAAFMDWGPSPPPE